MPRSTSAKRCATVKKQCPVPSNSVSPALAAERGGRPRQTAGANTRVNAQGVAGRADGQRDANRLNETMIPMVNHVDDEALTTRCRASAFPTDEA